MSIQISVSSSNRFIPHKPLQHLHVKALDESERRATRMLRYQKKTLTYLQVDTAFEHALTQAQKAEIGEEITAFYAALKAALKETESLLKDDDAQGKTIAQYTLQKEEVYLFRLAALLLQKGKTSSRKVYELKWLHIQSSMQNESPEEALRIARKRFETELLQYLAAVEATPQEQKRFRASQLRRFRNWAAKQKKIRTSPIPANSIALEYETLTDEPASTGESVPKAKTPQSIEHEAKVIKPTSKPPVSIPKITARVQNASQVPLASKGGATLRAPRPPKPSSKGTATNQNGLATTREG